MKTKQLAVGAILLLTQDITDKIILCKDETRMSTIEIAPSVNVPMMLVTRSFNGVKATICDRMEPMNDFSVWPSKVCYDGRTGEATEGIKNVFAANEKMMLQSKTPVEPPFAIQKDYQDYQIKCGYAI